VRKFRGVTLLLVLLVVCLLAGCSSANGDKNNGGEADLKEFPEVSIVAGDSEAYRLYSEGVQALLEQNLGIPVSVSNVDFATFLDKMHSGQYSMILVSWNADYNDPITFMDMWVTDGPFNQSGWSNQEYDECISTARTSTDNTERMEAFARAEEILAGELPIIPMFWPVRDWVQKDYVHGWLRKISGANNEWKYAWVDREDDTLNINIGENPPDLDPQTSTDQVSFQILNAVLEGLMRVDENMVLQPGLAADFPEVSEDGTVYTFTLKEGLKWSDGEPITAHDFEYAWKRAMNPLTGSRYNYKLEYIKGAKEVIYFNDVDLPDAAELSKEDYEAAVENYMAALQPKLDAVGVKALDNLTLEVILEQPCPFFLNLTSFITYLPAPMHLEKELGDSYATRVENMAFSGPFIIESWVHDSELVLVKNPDYWDAENVKLDKINMYMIKEISTQMNMYETGKLDATSVPGFYLENYKDSPDYGVMAEAICWYLQPNHNDPLMGNKAFRQAVSYAFDREGFINGVLEDGSLPATAFTPPTILDANGDSFHENWVGDLLPTTADTEKARQFLEQACEELGYKLPNANQ